MNMTLFTTEAPGDVLDYAVCTMMGTSDRTDTHRS